MNTLASPSPRTLIADDQPDVVAALRLLLKGAGYETEGVTSPAAALDAIRQRNFDLVIMDLNYARDTTSGQEGLDLISRIRAFDHTLPVVVITAWGSVELAVEAMQRGVRDFVQKPWENSRLLKTMRTQIELGRRRRKWRQEQAESKSANAKLQEELTEARVIQQALLPREIPAIDGFEIATAWRPARVVGGDYFDVFKFSDRYAAFCIADVAGKGMPAALLMSNMQAILKTYVSETVRPADLCARANSMICENIVPHRFITSFYCLLDIQRKTLVYANAGHCPPMLVRRDGSCLRLTQGGPVFGIFQIGRAHV